MSLFKKMKAVVIGSILGGLAGFGLSYVLSCFGGT